MRLKRRILYATAAFLFLIFLKLVKRQHDASSGSGCGGVAAEVHDDLDRLAAVVHQILLSLEVTHFLCYDSLWGSLNFEKQLPWKAELEFCAVNEKALYVDEARFLRTFRKRGLDVAYDWNEGTYDAFNGTRASGVVKIIIFENDPMTKMMRRVGWKRRVLPPDCESSTMLHCFPPRLIDAPLMSKKLGANLFPVPHEEIEIQKYLYPSNWWKDLNPPPC